MTTSSTFAIVGGGLAGAKAAEALRDNDFDGHVVLFAAEDHLPYERPPLSKDYLAGDKSLPDFTVDPAAWYRDHNVDLRLGTEVAAVDAAEHTLALPDGSTVGYDKLLLATGSTPRRPPIPGSDAAGVHYLRTIDDAEALSAALTPGSTLAIVGAGWIGLEVAAGARSRGVDVTVVEAAHQPLLAALGPEVGEVFAQLHREHGVDLRLDQSVQEITTDNGTATGMRLGDGSAVTADAVLVAVGAAPNIGLAERAGLAIADGGVLVDASLRSSDPDIYAVGDIAAAQHPLFDVRIRTEHWANALKQPAVAVAGMLGHRAEYAELPYFFTDQYDLGMEYVGHAPEYQRVVFRGDVAGREFVAFWIDAGNRVLAGMNVNVWDVLDDVKELIRSATPVDPERIADQSQPLPAG
ncbi:pyridine nucleotide-disulfide oxidoreductase [Mycolicibacterium setense]|uniref:NAD(P)/FAD-dependent oxidoreductase n=1 Tax=Mycolicibacterium setense TaxID=431269 RepID=UPI0007E94E02|nr:FAD-dependent oxidoreductase [Mycolicibacterium setense]OBB17930.1 pyridine nucleotide-disulfide oxidoreductase [Mycolicibacterium setense]